MTYPIKDLDPETWRRFRLRALAEGRHARSVLLELIERYASETPRPTARKDGK